MAALAGPALDAFLAAHLPLAPVPAMPEIVLHRAGPKSGLHRLAARDAAFASPYWAHPWAGGLALARFVLDNPARVAGRRVLDVGTGCGLVAIAAAKAGGRVLALDIDPYAVAIARLNASANGVVVEVAQGDATTLPADEADVVLVGDVFYSLDVAAAVMALLDGRAGLDALVGDPFRADLPREKFRLIVEVEVPDVGGGLVRTGVFALAGAAPQ